MTVVAWDDAFAFTIAAACKAAALTGRALRVFFATRNFMRGADIGATGRCSLRRCRLRVDVGASHNEP